MNEYKRLSGHRKYATREHTIIAEKVLGKKLPKGAQVHHIDGRKYNNANSNLVICPDKAYHALLHMRTDALNACGNPNWRKCGFCKKYDDPSKLTILTRKVKGKPTPLVYHKECNTMAAKTYRELKRENRKAA